MFYNKLTKNDVTIYGIIFSKSFEDCTPAVAVFIGTEGNEDVPSLYLAFLVENRDLETIDMIEYMKISPERLRSYLREGNGFYVGNDNYMAYLTEFPGGEDFCLTMIDSTEVLQETHSMYFTFPIFVASDRDIAC